MLPSHRVCLHEDAGQESYAVPDCHSHNVVTRSEYTQSHPKHSRVFDFFARSAATPPLEMLLVRVTSSTIFFRGLHCLHESWAAAATKQKHSLPESKVCVFEDWEHHPRVNETNQQQNHCGFGKTCHCANSANVPYHKWSKHKVGNMCNPTKQSEVTSTPT